MVPEKADLDTFSWFHYPQIIKTTDGEQVAEFPMSEGLTVDARFASPDKKFFTNYQGFFNEHNDLLIKLNLDFIDNAGVNLCFSKGSKFVKVSYLDGLERIFALHPDLIIKRINDTKAMGKIAPLNKADKERFLIAD